LISLVNNCERTTHPFWASFILPFLRGVLVILRSYVGIKYSFRALLRLSEQKLLQKACRPPCGPHPLRFALDHPNWGPRTLGWGGTLGTVACSTVRCRAPPGQEYALSRHSSTSHRCRARFAKQPAGTSGYKVHLPAVKFDFTQGSLRGSIAFVEVVVEQALPYDHPATHATYTHSHPQIWGYAESIPTYTPSAYVHPQTWGCTPPAHPPKVPRYVDPHQQPLAIMGPQTASLIAYHPHLPSSPSQNVPQDGGYNQGSNYSPSRASSNTTDVRSWVSGIGQGSSLSPGSARSDSLHAGSSSDRSGGHEHRDQKRGKKKSRSSAYTPSHYSVADDGSRAVGQSSQSTRPGPQLYYVCSYPPGTLVLVYGAY
jgi:hypothetical protein